MAPSEAGGNDGERERRQSSEQNGRRDIFRRPGVLIGGGVVLAIAVVGALMWWLNARLYESTDDAFIDAHIVRVAPQIAGRVARIDVNDNQLIEPGQLLVEIDPSDEITRLNQTVAQKVQAETQLAQAQAQIRVNEAALGQAAANASGAEAQAVNAARDLARYRALKSTTPLAVAQQQLDSAVATARNTGAARDAANHQVAGAEAQVVAAKAALAGAQASITSLKAQVAQAQLNLGYTRIVSPIAGHVTQRTVAIGNFVQIGEQLMAIVPLNIWVTANFKETQLDRMRPGQRVNLNVDACPSATVRGHVDSIQRGAGQAFGLLPPENATGNYVKVVQRVPVKILIDEVPPDCPLGPGMSVEPSVRVR